MHQLTAALLLALVACAPYTPLSPAGQLVYGEQLQSAAQVALAETSAAAQSTQAAHVQRIEQQRADVQASQTMQAAGATGTADTLSAAQTQAAATMDALNTQHQAAMIETVAASTSTAQVALATSEAAAEMARLEIAEAHARTRTTATTFGGVLVMMAAWFVLRFWFVPLMAISVERRRQDAKIRDNGRITLVYVDNLGRWAALDELRNTTRFSNMLAPPEVVDVQPEPTKHMRLILDAINYHGGDSSQTAIPSWTKLEWTSAGEWQAAMDELKRLGLAVAEPTGSRCADGYTLRDLLDELKG